MRAVIQRVRRASVSVEGELVGAIERGFVIFLGITHGDTEQEASWLASKIGRLRIFEDQQGKFNRSLLDEGGGALVVSQFTLYGDPRKGHRPSFTAAARPEEAEPLYERFIQLLRDAGVAPVEQGRFAARMLVTIENEGPVTILIDTDERGG